MLFETTSLTSIPLETGDEGPACKLQPCEYWLFVGSMGTIRQLLYSRNSRHSTRARELTGTQSLPSVSPQPSTNNYSCT
ncbi:hypothetical protein SAMN05421752_12035 [Natronorubrum thiooxidans]|uniref:Uncharacterized protein n=1 Tax=Natronorubrum thiooxidans TaxID=308853 RepID=A0A1N7H129_9EURY|nr:hypothetical protein SAMN05421752_12035 [Natronorubrum thiooxidans]